MLASQFLNTLEFLGSSVFYQVALVQNQEFKIDVFKQIHILFYT